MNSGVQWFCQLLVQNGMATDEMCRNLYAELEGPGLIGFAQEFVDRGLCDNVEVIQEYVNVAHEAAEAGEVPDSNELIEEQAVTVPESRFPATMTGEDLDSALLAEVKEDTASDIMTQILSYARSKGASDVHINSKSIPFFRLHDQICALSSSPLSDENAHYLNLALVDEEQKAEFADQKDITFALQLEDNTRYRVNLIIHKEGIAGTYHVVPAEKKSLEQLGFSNHENISKLLDNHNGLILVTGPAGSGKTTTLAALIDALNSKRHDHIITIEDPIEVVHISKSCFVTQREIGIHTDSYATALKGALREDPDVIVIGELYDLETIEMAVTAAETGHLVIGTLHTRDAATTMNRLLDVFPPSQQAQIRAMTSESLRGILCQQLLPRADGQGMIVAHELLINTPAVASIIREGRSHHLQGVMQTGGSIGMRSMDQCLYELFENGLIEESIAAANIKSREMTRRLKKKAESPADTAQKVPQTASKSKRGWLR